MTSPQKNFPWKIFYRLTTFQVVLILLAVLVGGLVSRYLPLLIATTVTLITLSIWNSRKLVFPISRLLLKTQSSAGIYGQTYIEQEFTEEPFGEWSDLESNIDSLHKKLAKATQKLTLEQIELDTVMSAISDAILAVDTEGVPLFFNSRFEVIFGSGTIRTHTRLYEIFREPEILNAFRNSLKEGHAIDTKGFFHEMEKERRFFSLSVSPLRKQGGAIYGALGIFHDITALKAAEQMRIDFVANVSHELRTPLTSIKGYAETMTSDLQKGSEKLNSEMAREYLKVINRNTTRLMNLMEDLLDLSAIESSTLLHKEPINLEDFSQRILKQLEEKFRSKSHEINLKQEVKSLTADNVRLEQVVINLLDNACKYTPHGGKITLSWEPDHKGGADVYLKVSDTGPGIAVEHQRRLFERFYRVDKARSREQGGTGLGLAIVKHILQRHEGSVWVESELGKGSTFICRFPAG